MLIICFFCLVCRTSVLCLIINKNLYFPVAVFITTQKGTPAIRLGENHFHMDNRGQGVKVIWRCHKRLQFRCSARIKTVSNNIVAVFDEHSH